MRSSALWRFTGIVLRPLGYLACLTPSRNPQQIKAVLLQDRRWLSWWEVLSGAAVQAAGILELLREKYSGRELMGSFDLKKIAHIFRCLINFC
jgi:hypothetical protein